MVVFVENQRGSILWRGARDSIWKGRDTYSLILGTRITVQFHPTTRLRIVYHSLPSPVTASWSWDFENVLRKSRPCGPRLLNTGND